MSERGDAWRGRVPGLGAHPAMDGQSRPVCHREGVILDTIVFSSHGEMKAVAMMFS